jgi:hypothetical protein
MNNYTLVSTLIKSRVRSPLDTYQNFLYKYGINVIATLAEKGIGIFYNEQENTFTFDKLGEKVTETSLEQYYGLMKYYDRHDDLKNHSRVLFQFTYYIYEEEYPFYFGMAEDIATTYAVAFAPHVVHYGTVYDDNLEMYTVDEDSIISIYALLEDMLDLNVIEQEEIATISEAFAEKGLTKEKASFTTLDTISEDSTEEVDKTYDEKDKTYTIHMFHDFDTALLSTFDPLVLGGFMEDYPSKDIREEDGGDMVIKPMTEETTSTMDKTSMDLEKNDLTIEGSEYFQGEYAETQEVSLMLVYSSNEISVLNGLTPLVTNDFIEKYSADSIEEEHYENIIQL